MFILSGSYDHRLFVNILVSAVPECYLAAMSVKIVVVLFGVVSINQHRLGAQVKYPPAIGRKAKFNSAGQNVVMKFALYLGDPVNKAFESSACPDG